jgi:hypothetical protein
MFEIMIGAAAMLILVHLGRSIVRYKAPYSYTCSEQDCYFEVRSDSKNNLDDAVVNHWDHHPMERITNV